MTDRPPAVPAPDLDRLIARCAHGELNPDERAVLPAALDAAPDGWRRLATVLLEDRLVAAALCEATSEFDVSRLAVADRRRADGAAARRMSATAKRHTLPLLAVAAALCAGVFGGWWAGRSIEPASGVTLASNSLRETPSVTNPAADVSPVTGPPVMWPADPLTPAQRRRLRAEGRLLAESRELVTVPLDDGRQLTVPVHSVQVRAPDLIY